MLTKHGHTKTAIARHRITSRGEVGGTGSREIVGIVGDVKHYGLADGDVPMFYTPQPHYPSYHTMTLVIRLARYRRRLSMILVSR